MPSVIRHSTLVSAAVGLLLMLVASHSAPALASTQSEGDTGAALAEAQPVEVNVKVIVVTTDLALRPVPKRAFWIRANGQDLLSFTTDFDGAASMELIPGTYEIVSKEALEFEGRSFSWNVEIAVAGSAPLQVELSNDNATVDDLTDSQGSSDVPVPMSEGELYKRYRSGVFTVLAEGGSGSGFLVDSAGLVMTNAHVVRDSDYLAVKISETEKYPARLLALDENNDVAILRVAEDVLTNSAVLPLAPDETRVPPASIGERVLAIGSPLSTETILTSGLVSKIEETVIYSDVNINPGNSGGPLLNLNGEVIGINTFGIGGPSGPGVSGIVRIHVAEPILAQARADLPTADPPESRRLPVAATMPIPLERLRENALVRNFWPAAYHVEAGKMDIQLITPMTIAMLEVEAEKEALEQRERRTRRQKSKVKEYTPGKDFYEWRRYSGQYKPIVRVQAVPEIALTGGSIAKAILLGPNTGMKFKFKTDFAKMELVRNGVVVEPIFPGKSPQVMNIEVGIDQAKDVAYFGSYEYPPEAFKPGAQVLLKIWQEGKDTPKVRELDLAVLNRVWNDFKPYFEALEETVVGKRTVQEEADVGDPARIRQKILEYFETAERWNSRSQISAWLREEGELGVERHVAAVLRELEDAGKVESKVTSYGVRYRSSSR